ncbi:MAG: hypothetical protein HYS13_01110 [Planctomycetia bacterium]|nr:hypothetical protein [Planctomycetia bacterium]
MSHEPSITLREDWLARRDRCLQSQLDQRPLVDIQLKLLNYLIGRYGNTTLAAQPARFPQPHGVYVNQRAIVVHHHLGRLIASGVGSASEAQRRVAGVVRRMQEHASEVVVEPEAANDSEKSPRSDVFTGHRLMLSDVRALARLYYSLIFPWYTPVGGNLMFGAASLSQSAIPLLRLRQAAIWQVGEEDVLEKEAAVAPAGWRTQLGDAVRELLAHPWPAARLAALDALWQIGDVQDCGLLLDLLALPSQPDEDPEEREALIQVVTELARRDALESRL